METKMTRCLAAFFAAATLAAGALKAQEDNSTTASPTPDHKLYMGEFGARYLPTVTALSVTDYNGTVMGKAYVSHGFGIVATHNFSKFMGLGIEVNYDKISQRYKDRGLDRKLDIDYINIPLMLSINTDKTMPVFFGVTAGPQFGINIGSKISGTSGNGTYGESDTLHAVLAVKQGDVGVAYGAGFGFCLNKMRTIRLDLGFRGVYGLVDIRGKQTGPNTYNILARGTRKTYGGYGGITFLF